MTLAVVKRKVKGKYRYDLVLPDLLVPLKRYLCFTIDRVILRGEPDDSFDVDMRTQSKWIGDFERCGALLHAHAADVLGGSPIPEKPPLKPSRLASSWPQLEKYRMKHSAGWLSTIAVSLIGSGP